MSRADLSPTALAELEIGSQQDHNARHERHKRMLSAAYEPPGWIVRTGIAVVFIAATFFLAPLLGPISFNPFVR